MSLPTRTTIDIRENRLENLTAEYRVAIAAGSWPKRVDSPNGALKSYDWAPMREHPCVSHQDRDGWVDADNWTWVAPNADGTWELCSKGGDRYTGIDAAECMAWSDIQTANRSAERRREWEIKRPDREAGKIWEPFVIEWCNARPHLDMMPDDLRIQSAGSAKATWYLVYVEWSARHPENIDWEAILEEAKERWTPTRLAFLEREE